MVFRFGPNELNSASFELRRSGRKVYLAARPMELLLLLVRRPGELVSREEIARALWPGLHVEDVVARINTAVAQVRAAIQEDPSKPRYLETVIGKGYRFIGRTQTVPDTTIAATNGAAQVDAGSPSDANIIPAKAAHETSRVSGAIFAASGVALFEVAEEAAAQVPSPSSSAADRPLAVDKHIARALPAGGIVILFVAFVIGYGYRSRLSKKVAVRTALVRRQLTSNDAEHPVSVATISPDGLLLAYMDPAGVFILEMATGRSRLIPAPKLRATRLLWFQDQDRLLLTGFRLNANQPEIWTLPVFGGAPRLYHSNAGEGVPAPNGRSIAFTVDDGREIRLANPDGTQERYVARGAEGELLDKLFWSPNGKRINFQQRTAAQSPSSIQELNYAWSYHSVDVETGHETTLRQEVGFDSAGETADGTLFYLRRPSYVDVDRNGLWMVKTDLATGAFLEEPHRIAGFGDDAFTGMSVSRDGKLTAIKQREEHNIYFGQLKSWNKTLTNVNRLTSDVANDFPHSWSADGKTVYFESDRVGGIYHIFRQAIDSAHAEIVTVGDRNQFFPAIMPDGATLIYEEWTRWRGEETRERFIYKAQADGSAPTLVWKGAELDEWRCPANSGTTCVLRTVEGQHLFSFYALDLHSGRGRELAHTSWQPTLVGDWALSPDGRTAAMPNHDPAAPTIRLIALDGSQRETKVKVHQPEQLWGVHWAANGQGFFAEARSGLTHRLQFISLAGDVSTLRQTNGNTWGVPTSDGSKLAFVDSVESQNVVALQ